MVTKSVLKKDIRYNRLEKENKPKKKLYYNSIFVLQYLQLNRSPLIFSPKDMTQ